MAGHGRHGARQALLRARQLRSGARRGGCLRASPLPRPGSARSDRGRDGPAETGRGSAPSWLSVPPGSPASTTREMADLAAAGVLKTVSMSLLFFALTPKTRREPVSSPTTTFCRPWPRLVLLGSSRMQPRFRVDTCRMSCLPKVSSILAGDEPPPGCATAGPPTAPRRCAGRSAPAYE
eukprot:scaffold11827_cov107-Isochrysis_galbana.AAC.5